MSPEQHTTAKFANTKTRHRWTSTADEAWANIMQVEFNRVGIPDAETELDI